MKEKFLNYLAVIIMAVITLTALILWLSGTVDIDSVIDFIDENRKIAVFGILALFLLKGFCPLIPYAAIVIASSAIFSLPFAALLSLAGTVICVSISYFAGRRTKSVSLETYLEKKPKLKKYFDGRNDTGFLFCFITHAVGLSLEAQGIIWADAAALCKISSRHNARASSEHVYLSCTRHSRAWCKLAVVLCPCGI